MRFDSQGIVNNANYLHYLEHTRHEFCEQAGISFAGMQKQGIDPVVKPHRDRLSDPSASGREVLELPVA